MRGAVYDLAVDLRHGSPTYARWTAETPIGLYFYDEEVLDLVRHLRPSERGELVITHLNLLYGRRRRLTMERLGRAFARLMPERMIRSLSRGIRARAAAQAGATRMRTEEIAFHNAWISAEELRQLARQLDKTEYARRLLENLRN